MRCMEVAKALAALLNGLGDCLPGRHGGGEIVHDNVRA